MEVTFDPEDKHLIFRSADGERGKLLPLKGISAAEDRIKANMVTGARPDDVVLSPP